MDESRSFVSICFVNLFVKVGTESNSDVQMLFEESLDKHILNQERLNFDLELCAQLDCWRRVDAV